MRRELLCAVIACSMVLTGGVSVGAQEAGKPVVGVIFDSDESDLVNRSIVAALRNALAERGRVDGENLALRFEYTDGFTEYLPRRLDELVDDDAAVLVSTTNDVTLAILENDVDIPTVMGPNFDAPASGLVDSAASPGGQVTGVFVPETALWAEKIDLLRSIEPDLSDVALLGDVYTADASARLDRAQNALQDLGLVVHRYELESSGDVLPALQRASKAGAQALLLVEGLSLTDKNRREIGWHAVSQKLLTMATDRDFVDAGFLMSLGPRRAELEEQVAEYVVALLDGTPVSELAITEIEANELAINLRTQKDLGIAVPEALLAEARLIE
jgi:putative ABC transport system substrate-binding protein